MKIEKAYKIATNCLRRCYSKQGILAGREHFSDCWARDSFFASFGACKLKDFSIVRKNLQLFLKHQTKDGQIPLRVGTYNLIPKMLNLPSKKEMKPRYTVDTLFPNNSKATDCNSLFIIATTNYVRESKDKRFAKKNYDKIKRAILWNFTQDEDKDLLMEDSGLTTWDDRTYKRGKVLYTNVLHFKALQDFSFLANLNKDKESKRKFKLLSGKVRAKINKLFWNGKFYVDLIEAGKKQNYFSSAGNALAILWVADKNKIKKIDDSIKRINLNDRFALKIVYPAYPLSKIYLPNIFLGFADYHTHMVWPWITCLYSLGLANADRKRAKQILERVASKIIEYNDCYEVYEENGKPVSRWFYKSEYPFAWFAGLFIYAFDLLYKRK